MSFSKNMYIKKCKKKWNKKNNKKKKKKRKKGKKEVVFLLSDPCNSCLLCYHGLVLGMICNMVMMAEGVGGNICSQLYPKFRDWKMHRKVNRTKEIVT